ncbi:hypothetical protein Tsp_04891 [Trichinella spiralis]|uniref:hypothetical protein n=1 Tax=Trichinella spiralis TaxID=6334 RepID=UPI0001EFE398|nr:hypothetical protein Tsp_04891 [Trichinella spiralis]
MSHLGYTMQNSTETGAEEKNVLAENICITIIKAHVKPCPLSKRDHSYFSHYQAALFFHARKLAYTKLQQFAMKRMSSLEPKVLKQSSVIKTVHMLKLTID